MFGVPVRKKEDEDMFNILEEVYREIFDEEREDLSEEARRAIEIIQLENAKYYNKPKKKARRYAIGNVVSIKRTQFVPKNKLYPKFLGPYQITKVKRNDRYDVSRIRDWEGPRCTSTSADCMKPWGNLSRSISSGSDDGQEGRFVGC